MNENDLEVGMLIDSREILAALPVGTVLGWAGIPGSQQWFVEVDENGTRWLSLLNGERAHLLDDTRRDGEIKIVSLPSAPATDDEIAEAIKSLVEGP